MRVAISRFFVRPLKTSVLALLGFVTLLPTVVGAQAPTDVPSTINYQGRLLQNTADQPAVDGTVDITFTLWTGPASDGGSTEVWSESWSGVVLSNGIFSVLLGSNGSPFDLADFSDETLFLQLEVDGEVLLPRQELGSSPFALVDEPRNEFQALELSGNTLSLTDSSITIDLSPYLDNTDDQDLSLSGNTLSLENDGSPVDLAGYLDNTDAQTLSLSGDTLTISGSGSSVDLGDAVEFSSLSNRLSAVEEALTRTVFLSSQSYAGSALGGLDGADAKCQALAAAAGLDGVFLAWLSDSTASPSNRFDRLGVFDLVDGNSVADDWSDLTDGTLDRPIDLDENGDAPAVLRAWTGTLAGGTAAAEHCSGWSGSGTGRSGSAATPASAWTDEGAENCDSFLAGLYCIEQVALGRDNQELALAGNVLQLTSDDGVDEIDLSSFLDDTNTDNQVLSLSGDSLQLSSDDGTDTVNLAGFLDNTDTQDLSLSGNTLSLTDGGSVDLSGVDDQTLSVSGNNLSIAGGNTVSLSAFKDNTDSQDIASVLSNGTDAGNRDLNNLDDVDIDRLTIDDSFTCDASSAACITSAHIEQDTILGNDITDRIFIVHIDCNGSCADMSMRDACDVIENLRGLDFEVELTGVSCVYDIPSTAGNGFVDCDDGTGAIGDNECRAFELRTLGDIPCINGDGTDAIVTCYATDIAK